MPSPRTYGDPCAAAHALDIVGERWALLVVRELLLGPKRFTDLKTGIPHASPNVLSQRLRELEDAGVVRRTKLPPPAASRVYELTEWGTELEPVIQALGRWGSRSPAEPCDSPLGADSLILALRTMFAPERADEVAVTVELRLGEDRFRAAVLDGELEIHRGSAGDVDGVIETGAPTLSAVLWEGRSPADARRCGDMRITGDKRAVGHFLRLFPLPEPVAITAGSARQ